MNTALTMALFSPLQMTQWPDDLSQPLPNELPEESWGIPSLFEQFDIRQEESIAVHWNAWPTNTADLGEHHRAIHAAFLGGTPPLEIEITNNSDPWQYLIMVVTIFQGRAEGHMVGKYIDAVQVAGHFFPWGDKQERMESHINDLYGDEINFDDGYIGESADSFSELSAGLHEATTGYIDKVREEVKDIDKNLRVIAANVHQETEELKRQEEAE